MDYRRDIDGLRAFAVIPVILFHAGFNSVPGGFLGVDVFFVISGFLITSILLNELSNSRFTLINFYDRRARRILPALTFVMIVTYFFGYALLSSTEFKELSQSMVAVALFLSNFFFYQEVNYFSAAAEEMPMLHTWSLAIEEQYYIFFPLILMMIWRFKKGWILPAIFTLFILSFVSLILLNETGNKSASFYLLLPRGWELLAGSLCAYYSFKRKIINTWAANIGLVLLVSSLIFWPNSISNPSAITIIPIVATCLIILFPHEKSLSYRILASKTAVSIGLISYSLYLWHQPIIAFLRTKSIGEPENIVVIAGVLLTFVMAKLTYLYVETPFRQKNKFSQKQIFIGSAFTLTFFIAIGLWGHVNNGLPDRFMLAKDYSGSILHSPKRNGCHSNSKDYISPEQSCTYFFDNVTWAVFGDSHTVEPAYALANILKNRKEGLSHHSFSGCLPALNFELKGSGRCTEWMKESLQYIESQPNIRNVLLGFRYSATLFGDHKSSYPDAPKEVVLKVKSPTGNPLSNAEKLELYWANLEEVIARLVRAGKTVYLMGPVPELPVHISKATTPFSIFDSEALLPTDVTTTSSYYNLRHKFILKKFKSIRESAKIKKIDTFELLCNSSGCPSIHDGNALYFDDDHLSIYGAELLLLRYFETHIEEKPDNLKL